MNPKSFVSNFWGSYQRRWSPFFVLLVEKLLFYESVSSWGGAVL